MASKSNSKDRIGLIIGSLLAVAWLQAPRLLDKFQVEEDFRAFYWMSKFQAPALFSHDQIGGSAYLNLPLPWGDWPLYTDSPGYGFLFFIASFFVTPIFFSKILPFFILPLTVWQLYEFGQAVRGREVGLILAVAFALLNLASPSSISVIGGLQRSFACSLLIALIYYLHRQKYIAAAVVVVLSALIYVPMFILEVVIWGLLALKANWPVPLNLAQVLKLPLFKRMFGPLLVAALLGVLVLSPVLFLRFSSIFTGAKTASITEQAARPASEPHKYLWDNPAYRAGGEAPLFAWFPLIGRGGLFDEGADAVHVLILLALSCLIYLVRRHRAFDLPIEVWCLLWATLLTFVMSWIAILLTNSFLFYIPSRYTRVGLWLFLLMFVGLNSRDSAVEALGLIRHNRQHLRWITAGVMLLVLSLVLLYPSDQARVGGFNMKWLLLAVGLLFAALAGITLRKSSSPALNLTRFSQMPSARGVRLVAIVTCLLGWAAYAPIVTKANFLDPPPAERALLEFLATLPADSLIAGTPCALDSVPLFAQRQILFSCERAVNDPELIREALNVYYADNTQVVVDFCQARAVDYLVVDLQVYTEEYLANGRIFFEPYNHELLPRIVDRDNFALAHVPDQLKIFQSENLFVVPCLELASISNE